MKARLCREVTEFGARGARSPCEAADLAAGRAGGAPHVLHAGIEVV